MSAEGPEENLIGALHSIVTPAFAAVLRHGLHGNRGPGGPPSSRFMQSRTPNTKQFARQQVSADRDLGGFRPRPDDAALRNRIMRRVDCREAPTTTLRRLPKEFPGRIRRQKEVERRRLERLRQAARDGGRGRPRAARGGSAAEMIDGRGRSRSLLRPHDEGGPADELVGRRK